MAINIAQAEATIEKLNEGIVKLSAKILEIGPRAEGAVNHWYVPDAIAKPLIWFANKMIEVGCWIRDKIIECLKGAAAPVFMYLDSQDWEGPEIRGKVSGVAGNTTADALRAPLSWKGDGADAYTKAVAGQTGAATQIETSSDKLATALVLCAVAGVAFYLALAAVLIKAIVVMVAAAVAAGSVVFSWAGLLAGIGEALSDAGIITGLVVALVGVVTAQAGQMTVAKGEANDNSAFRGGKWPVATA
ncbi:hypothetical protein [Streptomyces sp. ATexAB-D23]|uniref:hypothetical protein n=1 Tax=unclassified Streptomyces TaxID=2593676 RepID=UPI000476EE30|nr:hypothetical protein [Streptomyces sp. ATexAB-D23]MYY06752.1 hypothetical protein [Streptomyces sp. SID4913]